MRKFHWLPAALLCGLAVVGAVAWRFVTPPAAPVAASAPRWIVIGLDGGDWKILRRLWAAGALPNLKALAERGASASLATAYNSSPVIWTTIATGVVPEVHGITDFVVPTARGDVPISSSVRRVPALWNMLTTARRRVAVLGWWGSWPAESVAGPIVTDRVLLEERDRFSPADYAPQLTADLAAVEREPGLFTAAENERRDLLMLRTAARLAGEPFDLILCYVRSTDIVSHFHWRSWEPERFGDAGPDPGAAPTGEIPRIYAAVDREIGAIVRAAGPGVNVLVLSDHGFHAAKEEEIRVAFDLDAVLAELGLLTRDAEGVDFARSIAYTYASPDFQREKMIRWSLRGREPGGRLSSGEIAAWRRRLATELAAVTNERGEPVLTLREPFRRRGEDGDLVVVVARARVTTKLQLRGRPLAGPVKSLTRISGTHTATTHGILLAAGPHVQPGARLDGIHVHDIAPTLLYALGLPVADDFAGVARAELLAPAFRAALPLRRVASWGRRAEDRAAIPSAVDDRLLDELRALGYLR